MPHKRKDLAISGPTLWYLVGLITTDGCLSSDGRHIDVTAKDRSFPEKLQAATGIGNKISKKNAHRKNEAHHIQISNTNFYDFLLSVGLTPRKSTTQSEVFVPDEFFCDFLRGVIDGDGCIRSWVHPGNGIEQWSLRIYSSSPSFVWWLKREIESSVGCKGRIHKQAKTRPLADLHVLTYGKMAARAIFKVCYYKNALSLEKKAALAERCCLASAGWGRSKTVLN